MQSCKDVVIEGHLEYKWLFHYQDHFFKFSILAPCTSKSPQEVAHVIIKDVISVIGAPMLLQSDNGKEFSNEVISNIANMSGMKIIRGRPRHPQSQGSVERANGVGKQLLKWVDCLGALVAHVLLAVAAVSHMAFVLPVSG